MDSHGSSANSWLDTAEFPTQYYSTAHCTDFIHLLCMYFPFAKSFRPSCLPCAEVLLLLATMFNCLSSFTYRGFVDLLHVERSSLPVYFSQRFCHPHHLNASPMLIYLLSAWGPCLGLLVTLSWLSWFICLLSANAFALSSLCCALSLSYITYSFCFLF